VIYFIRAVGTDLVKIGKARDPERRLGELQTGSPHALKIEAMCRGYSRVERYLHDKCAERHVRGEWYRIDAEEVEGIVGAIKASTTFAMGTHPEACHVRGLIQKDETYVAEHLGDDVSGVFGYQGYYKSRRQRW
jgi:hypothetical protein